MPIMKLLLHRQRPLQQRHLLLLLTALFMLHILSTLLLLQIRLVQLSKHRASAMLLL